MENITVTKATCALVLKSTLEEFARLKRVIANDFPTTAIVFQKTSPGQLWITERDERT